MNETDDKPFGPIHVFFVIFVLVGGGLFCFKLYAFLSTIKKDELAGFAFDPVVIYGFVAMGFGFLLAWAYLSGQFRDIEKPKHEMLDRFQELERRDVAILEERGR